MLELNWKHSSGKLQEELSQEPYSIKRELHKLSKFYKIAENLALCYLIELLPKLSGERTHFCLSLRENYAQFPTYNVYHCSEVLFSIRILSTKMSEILYLLFPLFSFTAKTWSIIFPILTASYMIVIFQGVYLLITTTFDLGFLVLEKIFSK